MIKGLIRKLAGKVTRNKLAAELVAEKVDEAFTAAADAHTGGLASEVDGVVKRTKAKRRAKRAS